MIFLLAFHPADSKPSAAISARRDSHYPSRRIGTVGVCLPRELGIPLVASWHRNFHQFVARRLQKLIGFLPARASRPIVSWLQDRGLGILLWFYGFAAVTLAPTARQVAWLEKELRRPPSLMPRGIDAQQYNPKRRTVNDGTLRLGFVGRITPEKALVANGVRDFRIVIVGDGSEVTWLKRRLRHGEFTGVLRGDELAEAYANMDLFVFPSRADTFGNVIQEASASQVPSKVIWRLFRRR